MLNDDDLFQCDDDDDDMFMDSIINYDKIIFEETNHGTDISCFNCTGEDQLTKLQFHKNGFIRNKYVKQHYDDKFATDSLSTMESIELFKFSINIDAFTNTDILEVLFNKARMNIQYLIIASREDCKILTNLAMFELRLQVTTFLSFIKDYSKHNRLTENILKYIKMIRSLLNSITNLPIIKIIHSVYNTDGNKCSSAAFHLLHGNLEWRWLLLLISLDSELYNCNGGVGGGGVGGGGIGEGDEKIHLAHRPSLRDTEFEEELQLIVYDLCVLSICKFNKLKLVDLIYSSSFSCQCIKELWLLLQLLIENLHENDQINTFWYYYNKILEFIRNNQNIYINYQKKSNQLVINDNIIIPHNWVQFSLWHFNGVVKLNGFSDDGQFIGSSNKRVKENFEMLELLTKSLLTADPSEEYLRIALFTIIPIITEWWPSKIDIVMLFWEYFHRKLNSPFFIQGSSIRSLAVISVTITDYLEQIRSLFDVKKVNINQTSYLLFIFLLGKSLKQLAYADKKNQMQKIMGRIYSKFTATKLQALSETGIHNIITLFLTIALNSDLTEVHQRIQNFLLQIPISSITQSRQTVLSKGHISLMILYTENNINITNYIQKLLEQLQMITTNDSYLSVTRCLAEGLQILLNNSEYFHCGEPKLLDSWIIKYLSLCSVSEQNRLIDCVNKTLLKIKTILLNGNETTIIPNSFTNIDNNEMENLNKFLIIIYKHILPFIKQIFSHNNISEKIPEVAANFCLCTTGLNGLPTFENLFNYFHDINCDNIDTTIKFVLIIFSTDKINSIEQSLIIRNWIKCLMLSTSYQNNRDLKTFTNIVVGLEEFRVICDVETSEILNSNEPLYSFFAEIGKSYQNNIDFKRKYLIVEKIQQYLLSFEKWKIDDTPENLTKIYGVIGVIFLHCSQIIYIRGKSTCFFNVAMFNFILPTTLLVGKTPSTHIAQIVHKIWHLLITGIEKLDFKNDTHLVKILNDLIVKWLPHFKFGTNYKQIIKPYRYCLKENNELIAGLIFEKIAINFLILQRRQPHQLSHFVITIFNELLTSICDDENILIIFVKSILLSLFDHAVMVDETAASKNMIFSLLDKLFSSSTYRTSNSLKEVISISLQTITKNRISYYSSLYFQFLFKIVKINPQAVQNNMDFLKEQIDNVENLRGIGRDGKLRSQFDQLNGAIISAMTKL